VNQSMLFLPFATDGMNEGMVMSRVDMGGTN